MPPRTRSGLAEKRQHALLRAGRPNAIDLSSLPTELLLEIISHYPKAPIPHPITSVSPYPAPYLDRHFTLRSLSQTSRSLRSVFLPESWRTIEVCASMRVGNSSSVAQLKALRKDIAQQLVKQLEIVTIRDPTLAQYVRTVNVMLLNYSFPTVLQEFVRCLVLFPNLHTLQAIGIPNSETKATSDVFAGVLLPQVRNVVTSVSGYGILQACPGAESVTCIHGDTTFFMKQVAKNCKKVNKLGRFDNGYHCLEAFKVIIDQLPKVTKLSLTSRNMLLTPSVIRFLVKLKELTTITYGVDKSGFLFTPHYPFNDQDSQGMQRQMHPPVAANIEQFKNVLDSLPPLPPPSSWEVRPKRKLIIRYYDDSTTVYEARGLAPSSQQEKIED